MKKILIIVASLMLAAGIGLLLFEPVSNVVNKTKSENITEQFEEDLKQIQKASKTLEKSKSKKKGSSAVYSQIKSSGGYSLPTAKQLDRLLEDSKKYNEKVFSNQGTVDTSDYSSAALNLKKYGIYNNMYGYLSAPSIGLKLPIYLGANESMMSSGAAHLDNTSLPIKGKNVNCAISGHTGFLGRVFFDNIKHLSIGSKVSVHNYWGTINYKVIKTHAVAPNNTNDIVIQPDRQLLTLITCIYREKNKFDRYIVVCEKT